MCLAIPGKIIELSEPTPLTQTGKVSFGGVIREINLSLVPEAEVGNYVIVHVGVALSVLDEAEAEKTLAYLRELADLNESLEP